MPKAGLLSSLASQNSMKISASVKCLYIRNFIVYGRLVIIKKFVDYFRLRGRDNWVICNTSDIGNVFCQSNSNSLSDWSGFIVCSVKSAIFFPWQEVREDFWSALDKLSLCLQTNCNIVTP